MGDMTVSVEINLWFSLFEQTELIIWRLLFTALEFEILQQQRQQQKVNSTDWYDVKNEKISAKKKYKMNDNNMPTWIKYAIT